jgi:hypothetical protein
MIRRDQKSWEKGHADGARGAPSRGQKGLDGLS